MLDVAGDRGRELRKLNKDILAGGNRNPNGGEGKVALTVKKKASVAAKDVKRQSKQRVTTSSNTPSAKALTSKKDLTNDVPEKGFSPELTFENAKEKLIAYEEKITTLNSQLKGLEENLKRWRHVAGRDHLTSLPNKNSLFRLIIPKALKSLNSGGVYTCYGILFQQIAPINVRHGWAAGDQALLSAAKYLSKNLIEGEELFRLDGAIFAVWSSASLNVARPRSAELRRVFSNGSVKVGKGEMSLQASIGIVTVEKVTTDTVDGAAEKVFGNQIHNIFHMFHQAECQWDPIRPQGPRDPPWVHQLALVLRAWDPSYISRKNEREKIQSLKLLS